jgi:tRNA A37 methylthiotransferase MiaB
MSRAFDVGLESLSALGANPQAAHALLPSQPTPPHVAPSPPSNATRSPSQGKKSFFIETFGCQMNDHDSEKVSGVLLGRGYRAVETPAQADLVLYNTCSIREKAAQKIFARLGDWKTTSNGKIIGVLGCLAQQEGEEIFERAPWVSLVCGSASYRRLPDLIAELETGRVAQPFTPSTY